jgi:KDO2-lipid IV(A) lauroyltransferase
MNIKNFINDALAVRAGIFIGRYVPPKIAYRIADWIGSWIAKKDSYSMIKAVKANQQMVHNMSLSETELNILTEKVFQASIKSLYDYFYYIHREDKLHEVISYGLETEKALARIRNNQPTILLSPHLSNFDLMGHFLALIGIKVQVLSFPNPNDAYKMQNKLREKTGTVVTPMSFTAFRDAKKRLMDGGCVVTGIDRPIPGDKKEKYQPRFFGKEANLPVIHVRLAKETTSTVFVMSCLANPDHTYSLECSDAITIEEYDDLETVTIVNAEKILKVAEKFILKAPHQWEMFYPVWPEEEQT